MDAQDFTDVIQVCTDGSSLSEKGVTTAVELAKTLGLPLLGMTVVKGIRLIMPVAGLKVTVTRSLFSSMVVAV